MEVQLQVFAELHPAVGVVKCLRAVYKAVYAAAYLARYRIQRQQKNVIAHAKAAVFPPISPNIEILHIRHHFFVLMLCMCT